MAFCFCLIIHVLLLNEILLEPSLHTRYKKIIRKERVGQGLEKGGGGVGGGTNLKILSSRADRSD